MLISLYIENYALIDRQTIEFAEGFNVLTGETGAGKSIIVGAIAMIMGERASTDLIKSGKNKAVLEAVFDIRHKKISGFENEDTLIITRELSSNGRNLIKINSRTIPQAELKKVSRYLLDIHGQHQHQLLIDPDNHLEVLDLFIDGSLGAATAKAYAEYAQARQEHDLLRQSRELRQEEKDFLKFQLEELTKASPEAGEYQALKAEKQKLDAYTEIAEAVRFIQESAYTVRENLRKNKTQLLNLAGKDSSLQDLAEQAESLDITFDDFKEKLSAYADKLEYSPTRLDEINERLDLLNTLKRKHLKKPIADEEDIGELLQKKLQEIQGLLNNLEFSDERLSELEKKLAAAQAAYLSQARQLSQTRKAAAEKLEQKIITALQDLKMPSVKFKVDFQEKTEFAPTGIDQVEFLISPNPGEPLKPLAKIASGGELSRIMLAIKSILLDKDLISSMIFDEIDTGIGGDTANAIAAKIGSISKKHQVICVTHLAQIAVVADRHLFVKKEVIDGTTQVRVSILDKAQRETEIARMLSGKLTETTKAHAKELLRSV